MSLITREESEVLLDEIRKTLLEKVFDDLIKTYLFNSSDKIILEKLKKNIDISKIQNKLRDKKKINNIINYISFQLKKFYGYSQNGILGLKSNQLKIVKDKSKILSKDESKISGGLAIVYYLLGLDNYALDKVDKIIQKYTTYEKNSHTHRLTLTSIFNGQFYSTSYSLSEVMYMLKR